MYVWCSCSSLDLWVIHVPMKIYGMRRKNCSASFLHTWYCDWQLKWKLASWHRNNRITDLSALRITRNCCVEIWNGIAFEIRRLWLQMKFWAFLIFWGCHCFCSLARREGGRASKSCQIKIHEYWFLIMWNPFPATSITKFRYTCTPNGSPFVMALPQGIVRTMIPREVLSSVLRTRSVKVDPCKQRNNKFCESTYLDHTWAKKQKWGPEYNIWLLRAFRVAFRKHKIQVYPIRSLHIDLANS